MTYRIPLMRHAFINETETLRELSAWLASAPPRLSMGEQCAEFERQFAQWQGRKHAVLFNSGSSANLAIWQALHNEGLRKARVGFSALTWATNVMPLMQLGYTPLALDVDPLTLNLTAEILEEWIDDIHALFITNALGYLPDLDNILHLCAEHGVTLIEDNCESLGSALPAGRAGNFGRAASFSFFVAHHMSTIEGGMTCTDDDDFADMLRMVRANGWDRNLSSKQKLSLRTAFDVDAFDAPYTFYELGYNLRPTEITGFLGCAQLKHLDTNIERRIEIFKALEEIAVPNPDFLSLYHGHMSKLSPFAFPVVCVDRITRNRYIQRFEAAGVEVRPIIAGNITRQPFYRRAHPLMVDLPGADAVHDCGFYFGVYPEMTKDDIRTLRGCLEFKGYKRVKIFNFAAS